MRHISNIDDVLDRYGMLLHEVDQWFSACVERYPAHICCTSGCAGCCRGLFDITILDALYLRRGVDELPRELRTALEEQSRHLLGAAASRHASFSFPWFLNHIPDEEWQLIMPEDDPAPCVLLGADGLCQVYRFRPMTCRLHGIPLYDLSGQEHSDEWCTLNFRRAHAERFEGLRYDFNDLFAQELLLVRELTGRMSGAAMNEMDTVVPGAVIMSVP